MALRWALECNGLITSVDLNSGLPVKQIVIDFQKSKWRYEFPRQTGHGGGQG
jgi:hypothetical protein